MNELFSPLRRRVELSVEPPFVLGAATVRPAALEVAWGARTDTLEPRVMQVLVALHRARGEPVSRDELSEFCWEGRVVGEDALNRCVGRLRKVLAADPRVVIDTIPKIGYRLRVSRERPAEQATAVEDPAPPAPARRGRVPLLALAGVAALAVGAAAAATFMRPTVWSAEGVRPLTAEPGVETHPALSPDGRFLVYAAGRGFGAPRDLWLKGVGDGQPIRLTETGVDESAAAWSPDGERIAFVRETPGGGPCVIVSVPVPRGPERVLARCTTDSFTRLAWTADGEVLFADRPRPDAVKRLRAVDAETGAVRDLTRPDPATLGDSDPVVSPDGRSAVFRRSEGHGVDDLWRVDLRSGAERPITRDGWKASGFAVAPDGRTLFYSSNRGGDFGLWAADLAGGGEPRRVSLGLLSFGRLSIDGQGRLATESSDHRSNLFSVRAGAEPVALTASSGSDWEPDLAADGSLAFVSDQSGAPEVWVRRPGGEPARLTELEAAWVSGPRWSPDGRTLAFVAAREHRTDVYVVAPDGSGLRRLTRDGGPKADVAWSADAGSLLFTARRADGWRLERAALAGAGEAVPGGAGLLKLRRGPDGALYGLKQGDNRLWRADGAVPARLVAPEIRVNADHGWTVGPDGVYQAVSRPDGTVLRVTDWAGRVREIETLPTLVTKYSIAVSADGREVVLARMIRDEADVMLIDLRRGRG